MVSDGIVPVSSLLKVLTLHIVVGMLLTIFGFSLLLLPFSIQQYAPDGWKTGYIIAMIVLGVVCLVGFVIWEKYLAPVRYMPWKYLKNGTILLSCMLYGIMFLSILYVLATSVCFYIIIPTNFSQRLGYILLLVPNSCQRS